MSDCVCSAPMRNISFCVTVTADASVNVHTFSVFS